MRKRTIRIFRLRGEAVFRVVHHVCVMAETADAKFLSGLIDCGVNRVGILDLAMHLIGKGAYHAD